jgi:uncharacterized protein (DUF2141 family)
VRHGSRALAALALSGAAAALAGASAPAPDVRVTVTGLRSHKGLVRACLTADPRNFPDCSADKAAHTLTVPASGEVVLDFTSVERGRYAISLLHDENGNGRADMALSMIPKEGFGFSRDAPVRMGPPKFAAAAFDVESRDVSQTIRMRYLL